MSFDEICQELNQEFEKELAVRINEILKLESLLLSIKEDDEDTLGIYLKSLIIVLYSHFEGYCKKLMLIYIDYLNNLDLQCKDVQGGLMASCLYKEFQKLSDGNYKPVILGERALSDDTKLHLYGRRREFVQSYEDLSSRKLKISDSVVDTESNLKSHILKKLLYQIEADFQIVDQYQDTIDELVNKRNAYAHGVMIKYPSKNSYIEYRDKTLNLMKELKAHLYVCFSTQSFLKSAANH